MNKLNGMPCPNVINLSECEDRKRYMANKFAEYGVSPVFYSYSRFEDSDNEIVGDESAIALTSKGCFSSHLLTIRDWLLNTEDELGIFFEDDVDFETVKYWNFNFDEFIASISDDWDAFQLCGIYETYPLMIPRTRKFWDHGIQCYMLKRSYAQRLVDFYFKDVGSKVMHYSMPEDLPPSVENNILNGFGPTLSFPLFNHNINDFKSENINPCIDNYNQQTGPSIFSYRLIEAWWRITGSKLTLQDIIEGKGK